MLQFGRGEMSEYFSFYYRSYIYRINNNLFLWKITKSTYCICICVFNYEFSLLGNRFYKFVSKLKGVLPEDQLNNQVLSFFHYWAG
jgi:hypothetical protein